jgi:hypothetical protein
VTNSACGVKKRDFNAPSLSSRHGSTFAIRPVLSIETFRSALRLRNDPPIAASQAGEQAISFGYRLSGALASEGNLTVGNVSALHGLGNDPKEIQITTPVQAGNSGGPLLDRNGNVIGVVAAKLNAIRSLGITGDLPQNVNFAIGLPALRSFLTRNNVPVTEAQSLDQLDPSEVGDHARLFTYAIECDPQGVDQGVVK